VRAGGGGAAVRWADEGGAAARRVNGVDRLANALETQTAHPTHAGLEPASSPLSSFSFPPAAAASPAVAAAAASTSPATRAEIERLARGLLAGPIAASRSLLAHSVPVYPCTIAASYCLARRGVLTACA